MFYNYKKLNLTEEELIVLILIFNMSDDSSYDPNKIALDLNMDKLKDMFTVKENNMPKTNSCNAKNFGELIYKKKIDSDFSKEMNRSIIENIKCFIDEK